MTKSSRICHIEILAAAFTYPDPDGDGVHGGVRGDIRLIARVFAQNAIKDALRRDYPLPCRILPAEESAALEENLET